MACGSSLIAVEEDTVVVVEKVKNVDVEVVCDIGSDSLRNS